MPNKTFNARVQMKRDTSTNWTSNNPVLLYGEIIIVDTDAGEVRFKVGNGTSTYTQLPFTDEAIINKMLSVNGGTMAGNINMSGHSVTGLAAPVNPTDAVRQQDLEVLSDEIDGIIAGTSPITLPIASDVRLGGVKVGEGVEIAEDGTISVDAINQSEADARYLQLTGGSVTGPISFGSAGIGKYTLEDGELAIRSSEVGVYSTSGDLVNPMFSVSPSIARLNTNLEMGAGVSIKNDTVPADGADLTNKTYVDNAIAAQVGSVYKPAGSVTFANLPSAVTADMLGRVYNVTDEFVADGRFLSVDVGETYPAGSNVAVVEESEEYFYDVLSGNIDLSDYVTNTQFTQGLAGKIDNPVGGSNGNYLTKTTDGVAWTNQPVRVINVGATGTTVENAAVYAGEFLSGTPVFAYDTQSQQMIPCVSATDTGSMVFFGSGINSSKVPGYFRYISITNSGSVEANEQVQINASQIPYAGDVTGGDVATAIDTLNASIDSAKPLLRTVTLTTSGWSGNSQTVTVNGVLANESLQEINLAFGAKESAPIWAAAGCWCSAQGANSLTFTCDAVPTGDISLRIAITGAQT